MSKFQYLVGLILFSLSITCLANSRNDNFANKEVYLSKIEKLSDTDRTALLEKDIQLIEKALEEVKNIHISFGFSFSSGSTNEDLKDQAAPFVLDSVKNIVQDFEKIQNNSIIAYQDLTQGMANFKFSPDFYFDFIERSDLAYKINGVFENGIKNKKTNNYLLFVDSLDVNVSYSYPTAFEKLVIKPTTDSLVYNNQTLYVDSSSPNTIEIELPINIDIIGYQASSKRGLLMNKSNYSNFPITGFSPTVLQQITDALNDMKKALHTNEKTQSVALLKEIPEDTFQKIDLTLMIMSDFENTDKDDNKDLIKKIKIFREKYSNVLAYTAKSLDLGFPVDYSEVYLYVATKREQCNTDIVVPVFKEALPYNVFSNDTKTKFGIVDDKGQIIVPAIYSNMSQTDTLYFKVKDGEVEKSIYLNPNTLKIEELPANLIFNKRLNNNLAVFSNKDGYRGLLKNHKTELIPFKYDNFKIIDNVIVAEGSKRGRSFYEFYSLDGKLLNIPPVDNILTQDGEEGIIIESKTMKYGYLNKDGKLMIPMVYRKLDVIGGDLLTYQTDKNIKSDYSLYDNISYLYGIIDTKGNKITEPIYYSISPLEENKSIIELYIDEGEYGRQILYGYIDQKGQVIIEPQFEYAKDFYKDYALVKKENVYMLIDTKGNTIKKFDDASYVRLTEIDEYYDRLGYCYKTTDGEIFNYKGDKIN